MTFKCIPKELQALPRWLFANRDKAPSDASGTPLDGTDPQNWLSFDAVIAHLTSGDFDPDRILPFPGFEFMAQDSIVFIDIDLYKISDPETRTKSEKWVEHLGTYTELSTSGRGLHLIAQLDGNLGNSKHDWLEIYTDHRFGIITGNAPSVHPVRVVSSQLLLDAVNEFFPPRKPHVFSPLPLRKEASSLDQVLERMQFHSDYQKFLDAFHRRLEPFDGDWSRADFYLCLCFLRFTSDPEKIRQFWLASPLGKRRKLAERPDYVERTIRKAFTYGTRRL
jgi:primase-polymerase (primpol)-like protein